MWRLSQGEGEREVLDSQAAGRSGDDEHDGDEEIRLDLASMYMALDGKCSVTISVGRDVD